MDEVWRYIRRALEDVGASRGSVWQAAAVYAAGGAVFGVGTCIFTAIVEGKPDYRGVLSGGVGFAAIFGIIGAVAHTWNRDLKPRLRASVRPHHIVKAVLVVAVAALIALFWWPYPGAVPAHHDRLATAHHVRVVALILVATLFINPGPLLFARNPNTVQVRRVAGGLACLAVVAFVVKSMADDLGSYAAVRGFFEEMILRQFSAHPVIAAPYAALLLLAVISAFRVAVGLRGPFPRDPMELGKAVLGLAVWGGLWLWGVFVPASWDWLDLGPGALNFTPDALNFGLTCLYLLSVVESIGWIVLMLYRPDLGGRGPVEADIERQKKRW